MTISGERLPSPAGQKTEDDDSAATRKHTETIRHEGKTICIIVRSQPEPGATTFYTPEELNMQLGHIVYAAGGEIPRHMHRPLRRSIDGTAEVLIVQKGRMILDLYGENSMLLCSREIASGDVVVLEAGGHGFRLLEDTVILEVKQGPYPGPEEKLRF